MKSKIHLWTILIGLTIGLSSYGFIPYQELNLLDLNIWLVAGFGSFIGSFLSSFFFDLRTRTSSLSIALGVILFMLLRIIYDQVFIDSSSHNLAPFEFAFGILQSWPAAFLGAYTGKLIRKKLKTSKK